MSWAAVGLAFATLATYFLCTTAGLLLLFVLCPVCASDNAYLGQLLFALISAVLTVLFGVLWLAVSRRGLASGLLAGGIPAIAASAVTLAFGATRTVTPPPFFVLELGAVAVGLLAAIVVSALRSSRAERVSPSSGRS